MKDISVSVIFLLFCANDLQRLSLYQLAELRDIISNALGLKTNITCHTAEGAPALPLAVSDDTQLPQNAPPEVIDALKQRFDEVSQQLKSPPKDPSSFHFDTLVRQHFNEKDIIEKEKETTILRWAISCEVNNFKFYEQLLRAREEAYQKFYEWTQQRPKGPDSLYSPFNPLHPLYNLFYSLSQGGLPIITSKHVGMIETKTRREAGFQGDNFDGHILYKDNQPILQIHFYPEYYTIFWKGAVDLIKLDRHIAASIVEISKAMHRSIDSMNSGTLIYNLGEDFSSRQFVVDPQTNAQRELYNSYYNFLTNNYGSVYFVRFDIVGSQFPIIFWADNPRALNAETGFSSIRFFPDSVMELFKESSRIDMSSDEYTEIKNIILEKLEINSKG
jgi:hypothetical protein